MNTCALLIAVALSCLMPQEGAFKMGPPSVEEICTTNKVPGLIAGCVTKNGVEFLVAAGVRKKGDTAALQATDRMHLGSCNKAITATLAAVLVADGTLKWESTLGEVLGKSEPAMNEGWKAVTLEQLLRHRGGAPESVPADEWKVAWDCTDPPQKCRQAFVHTMLSKAPAHAAGTMKYSNQGYAMVGRMCEEATGQPYESLVMARVLDPLGIKNAGFGQPSKADPASPVGHDAKGAVNDTDNPAAIAPAGTLHMPAGEWLKFIAFHIGAQPPAALMGASKQLAALHKASGEAPGEALGWMCTKRPWGGNVLTHSGSNNLWFCTAWIAPDKGFGVVALCNQGGSDASKACDQACSTMITKHTAAEEDRVRNQKPKTAR